MTPEIVLRFFSRFNSGFICLSYKKQLYACQGNLGGDI